MSTCRIAPSRAPGLSAVVVAVVRYRWQAVKQASGDVEMASGSGGILQPFASLRYNNGVAV